MTDDFFGTHVVVTGQVKYVGEGDDPSTDPSFIIWKNAVRGKNWQTRHDIQ